ncbi:hypothetical protein HMPREF3032_00461 [Veillonella sp. DNF00869]|nr:hypothetical protein HMPREF3032_00461 [Veillonella sp. DNF00869]
MIKIINSYILIIQYNTCLYCIYSNKICTTIQEVLEHKKATLRSLFLFRIYDSIMLR